MNQWGISDTSGIPVNDAVIFEFAGVPFFHLDVFPARLSGSRWRRGQCSLCQAAGPHTQPWWVQRTHQTRTHSYTHTHAASKLPLVPCPVERCEGAPPPTTSTCVALGRSLALTPFLCWAAAWLFVVVCVFLFFPISRGDYHLAQEWANFFTCRPQ